MGMNGPTPFRLPILKHVFKEKRGPAIVSEVVLWVGDKNAYAPLSPNSIHDTVRRDLNRLVEAGFLERWEEKGRFVYQLKEDV